MRTYLRWSIVLTIIVGILLPLIPLAIWSFARNWFFPGLLPQSWSLDAWRYVFSSTSRVGEGLATSLALAIVVMLLSIIIGLPAARVMGMHTFRGKRTVEWLIMLPIIVPTLVVVMGIQIIFIRYGLADTFGGVALVHLVPALPYFILVMASVFANYNVELEETARTLGANPVRTFWYVTLPAIFPGLVVASLFTFLVSWSQYITTVLIGGGGVITLPMVLFPFISGASHARAAAISIVFILPAILVLGVTSRTLSKEAGAVSGFGRF